MTVKVTNYGPYWGVSFKNKDGVEIRIRGENDGFDIVIIILEEEFPLWKYNRSVINFWEASKENILYQLNVLKSFLEDNNTPT
ncbi:hypothetical protein [Tenacibaculum sp. UWU-22]|uniref:hypothetical protein n=1 Tax=Tenacibaculum sp. UWU-22 TaxID=3234187 RepID=UPI0034DAF3C5